MHGKFGDQLIFRLRDGKSVTANKPKRNLNPPAATQLETRDRFLLASIWAKSILKDPAQKSAYQANATKYKTAYVVAMTDYLKPPRILEIDLKNYEGHTGNVIRVVAFDDFVVTGVTVKLEDPAGNVIEEGACLPGTSEQYWLYTALFDVTPVTGVVVTATATDNPGNTGTASVVKP